MGERENAISWPAPRRIDPLVRCVIDAGGHGQPDVRGPCIGDHPKPGFLVFGKVVSGRCVRRIRGEGGG